MSVRGIPGQVAKLTAAVADVQDAQVALQRVVDDEILPALREVERRADMALRVARKARRVRK